MHTKKKLQELLDSSYGSDYASFTEEEKLAYPDIGIQAMSQDPNLVRYVPLSLLKTPEYRRAILQFEAYNSYLHPSLRRHDVSLAMEAVQRNASMVLRYIDLPVEKMKDLLEEAMKQDVSNYALFKEEWKLYYPEMAIPYISVHKSLSVIPVSIQTEEMTDMVMEEDPHMYQYVSEKIRKERPDYAYRAVEIFPRNFEYVPSELRTPKLVRLALKGEPANYELLTLSEREEYRKETYDVVLHNSDMFQYVPATVYTKKLLDLAVSRNLLKYENLPLSLRDKYPSITLLSVIKDPKNIRYVPEKRMTKRFLQDVLHKNPEIYRYLTEEERQMVPSNVMENILTYNPTFFRYIPAHLQTIGLSRFAVEKDPSNYGYVDEDIRNKHPQLAMHLVQHSPYFLDTLSKETLSKTKLVAMAPQIREEREWFDRFSQALSTGNPFQWLNSWMEQTQWTGDKMMVINKLLKYTKHEKRPSKKKEIGAWLATIARDPVFLKDHEKKEMIKMIYQFCDNEGDDDSKYPVCLQQNFGDLAEVYIFELQRYHKDIKLIPWIQQLSSQISLNSAQVTERLNLICKEGVNPEYVKDSTDKYMGTHVLMNFIANQFPIGFCTVTVSQIKNPQDSGYWYYTDYGTKHFETMSRDDEYHTKWVEHQNKLGLTELTVVIIHIICGYNSGQALIQTALECFNAHVLLIDHALPEAAPFYEKKFNCQKFKKESLPHMFSFVTPELHPHKKCTFKRQRRANIRYHIKYRKTPAKKKFVF